MRDKRLHAEITHVDRVLQHERVQRAVGHSFEQRVRRVEADEPHLARPPVAFEHAQHRERRRLIGREDAVDVELSVGALQAAEERLASLVGALDVGAAVLIRADDLDPRTRFDRFEKSLFTLDRALRSFGVAQHHDSPFVVQQARQVLARQPAALAVVGRDEAHEVAALQTGVDDDDIRAEEFSGY